MCVCERETEQVSGREREVLMQWCCDSSSAFDLWASVGHFANCLCEREWETAVEVAISALVCAPLFLCMCPACLYACPAACMCVVAGYNWDSSLNPLEDWWPKLYTNSFFVTGQLAKTHMHARLHAQVLRWLCACLKFQFTASGWNIVLGIIGALGQCCTVS